jgi:hypothetical protein
VFSKSPTNGPGGPFSGDEVLAALRDLGWELVEITEDNVAVVFYPKFGETVYIDLDRPVFYADRFFRATARWMIDPVVAGKTMRDAVVAQMKAIRDAIIRVRTEGGEAYTPAEGEPQ